MTFSKTLLLTATTVLLTSASAMALGTSGKMKLLDADLNNDASITFDEFSTAAKARFAAADTDGNGFLTDAEQTTARQAARTSNTEARFDAVDTNGDGVLSRDEVQASQSEHGTRRNNNVDKTDRAERDNSTRGRGRLTDAIKAKIDTDGDGEISDAEKDAARDTLRNNREERSERADRNNRERGNRERGQRNNIDADDDGMISLAELDTKMTELFTRMDSNQDGVLTEADRSERGNRRQGRRGGNK